MEMERLKQAMDQEHGPSTASWCRFHRLLELMERNWAQLAFTPRHWYHNRAEALTVRYTVEELVKWDETHDDENEEPEGWDKSSVNALAVDAGGRIVTGGDDGSVRVWDAHGSLHGSYTDEWNWNSISCVCHDDRIVVGAYSDRPVASKTGVLVWDLATGEQKQRIPCAEEVKDLALRAPFLVGACGDVLCWDLNTGEVVQTLECSYPMEQIDFHPTDPNMLLTGSIYRNKVWLWDVRVSKKYVGKATLGENLSPPFAFDDSRLVAGEVEEIGEGGAVRVWDLRNLAKPLLTLREPTNGESTGDVYAVQFHNDIIVSSHEVGGIRLWSMADGTLIDEDDSLPLISRIVVDRDEGRCFVGGDDGGVFFIDLHREASEWRAHREKEGSSSSSSSRRRSTGRQLGDRVRVVQEPVPTGGPLGFADLTGLQVTRRGVAAAFRDSSIRFYDFAPLLVEVVVSTDDPSPATSSTSSA